MGWMYRTMAGIRPGEKGGYEKFVLAPRPDRRIGSCTATYRTKYGTVKSAWRYDENGKCHWTFTVPPGTHATVLLPGSASKEYSSGNYTLNP